MIFHRLLHQSSIVRYFMTTTGHYSQPSKLATLRKKTGYSIAHCKKALEVTGNQDIDKVWVNMIVILCKLCCLLNLQF